MDKPSAVKKVKEYLSRMNFGRAVFVGDAGNFEELAKCFGRYILATRVGRSDEVRNVVLSRQCAYSKIKDNLKAKEVIVTDETSGLPKRYVICMNDEEAARRRHHRDGVITELNEKLSHMQQGDTKEVSKLRTSRRFGPYLSKDGSGKLSVDKKKSRLQKDWMGNSSWKQTMTV